MGKMNKFLHSFILLSVLLGFCCISCSSSDDDGNGTNPASHQNPSGSNEIQVSDVEKYDISTASATIELKNSPYELQFTVPATKDETWEAILAFDPSDLPEGEDEYCYELGTLGSNSGTGAGKFSLFVYDNQTTGSHRATLSVTSSAGTVSKTITLIQIPTAANEDEVKANPSTAARRMIGYGYDYTAGYATEKCLKNQVLNVAMLCSEDGVTIDYGGNIGSEIYKMRFTNFSNDVTYMEACGVNTAEIELKIAGSLEASYDANSFSAEIENHTEWDTKNESKYQFGWADIKSVNWVGSIDGDRETIYNPNMLTKSAYRAINGISKLYKSDYVNSKTQKTGFYNLIRDYGAYVVVGGELGGVANVTMQVDDSDITEAFDTESMLKLAYDGSFTGQAEVNADYKATYTAHRSNFKFHSSVRGGEAESANAFGSLLTNIDATTEDRKSTSSSWKSTLTDIENCVFLGFSKKEQLIPIYEFVDLEAEGGEERREALEEYFETLMLKDFPEVGSQGKYVETNPSKMSLPTFDSSNSLIKDIKLNEGVMSVRACSEFIPEINSKKRITILYPADNDKVFWNKGLYLGDTEHPPHSISWNKGELTITAHKGEQDKETGDFIVPKTVYRFGTALTTVQPVYLMNGYAVKDTLPAEEYFETLGGKNRALVKIAGNIFQRDYWDYGSFNDSTTIYDVATGTDYDADFRNHKSAKNIPIKGWIQKKVGETEATSKENTIGDGIYYPSYLYGKYHDSHGGLFPAGWDLPDKESMQYLIKNLQKITDKTDIGGNIASAFLNPDVLGLRIQKYGYISFWNGASASFYSQENKDTAALFPVRNGTDYEDTYKQSLRMVISDTNASIVTHNLKHSVREKDETDDNHDDFISKRGPAYTLLLCKKIN